MAEERFEVLECLVCQQGTQTKFLAELNSHLAQTVHSRHVSMSHAVTPNANGDVAPVCAKGVFRRHFLSVLRAKGRLCSGPSGRLSLRVSSVPRTFETLHEHVLAFIYSHRHALQFSCEHDGENPGRASECCVERRPTHLWECVLLSCCPWGRPFVTLRCTPTDSLSSETSFAINLTLTFVFCRADGVRCHVTWEPT